VIITLCATANRFLALFYAKKPYANRFRDEHFIAPRGSPELTRIIFSYASLPKIGFHQKSTINRIPLTVVFFDRPDLYGNTDAAIIA